MHEIKLSTNTSFVLCQQEMQSHREYWTDSDKQQIDLITISGTWAKTDYLEI